MTDHSYRFNCLLVALGSRSLASEEEATGSATGVRSDRWRRAFATGQDPTPET